jgi:hypothetical protein
VDPRKRFFRPGTGGCGREPSVDHAAVAPACMGTKDGFLLTAPNTHTSSRTSAKVKRCPPIKAPQIHRAKNLRKADRGSGGGRF